MASWGSGDFSHLIVKSKHYTFDEHIPTITERQQFGCCNVDDNIYIFGGLQLGYQKECLSDMVCLNTKTLKWKKICKLFKCFDCDLHYYKDNIYIYG
eukprot:848790_1